VKLASLRVFGFKTFAEQTALRFEPGITALVGPNGSGKSNLVDAIRWVLGEQSAKSLRSTKTEDVIFAGNERRRPLGMAEVSLTFANDDGALRIDASEVQLTRRAYRAGESEFFINRQSVRLRDVVELLMGTGLGPGSYAIVSQGQIDAILAAKPTERRGLFEETAGINRFLARKNESLRRLEQTEQNGIRTSDLLGEIAARIPELETQARRARRFRKASARARDLEILSYVRSSASRRAERERLAAAFGEVDARGTAAAARAATLEAGVATAGAELLSRENALDEVRARTTEARATLGELDSERAALGGRYEALAAQSARYTGDRERAERERAELGEAVERLESELGPKSEELERGRSRERDAREALGVARAALDRIFAAVREVEAAASASAASEAERRAHIAAARGELDRLERETIRLREDAASRGERLAAGDGALGAAREVARAAHEVAAAAQDDARRADARASEAMEALAAAEAALRLATSDVAGTEARLHTIEELEANLEGHVPGTRAVLEATARREFTGIVGVVSNLVRVDERYARALDIAFGPALSNIVTERAEDAQRAIEFLRASEAGRATFLPLDTLGARAGRGPADGPQGPGVVGYAHELASATEARFAGIVAFLVGRILVVESLDVGVPLVRGGFRDAIVTLEGDEIRGGGAMTGGRYKRERSILSRRAQARTLSSALPGLRARLAAAEGEAERARGESAAAARERAETHRAEADLAARSREAQGTVERLQGERERLERERSALAEAALERAEEAARVRSTLAALDRPLADPGVVAEERDRLEAQLLRARETIAHAQNAERTVAAELATLREHAAALAARRDAARTRIDLLDADGVRAGEARERMAAELSSLEARLQERARAREGACVAIADASARLQQAERERDDLRTHVAELEAGTRIARGAERDAAAQGESSRLRLAEIEAELGMLVAQFAQHPASAQECADVEARFANEPDDVAAELARLREELARAQNVNLNAETEIAELSERERFLREQLDDLARARETLLASIREIEESSQQQFDATFALVRAAFEDVYARLFPGGEARMWQTGADSLSDVGIEMSVQPPGKKMMPLTALSGGERAMAASALIFALIAVKPSPFYLLDEVDAALDDANVERFSELVREVGAQAQLLIVTHNKKTMELADRLYGVTMREPGISSVIATDLAPARDATEVREPVVAG